jgi:hypothetical protein
MGLTMKLGELAFACRVFRKVRNQLEDISHDCRRNGFELSDLPKILGRSESSLPKLIDEYHWVTITRGCPAPGSEELKRWMAWS